MDPQQRAKIRNAAPHFIRSPQFVEYLATLYSIPPSGREELLQLQAHYSAFAESAVVEMAFIWMVNSRLTARKVASAPGLLIAGADGSEESEQYVQSVCSRIANEAWGEASPATIKQIRKEISDEKYRSFRIRTLPLEFTENYPVYLFDTMLAADNVLNEQGMPIPFVPCLVNPTAEVKIFPIPLFVYATAHLIEAAPPPHIPQPPPFPPATSAHSRGVPATRKSSSRSGCGRAVLWAFLIIALLGGFVFWSFSRSYHKAAARNAELRAKSPDGLLSSERRAIATGETAFKTADLAIMSDKQGAAQGNSPEAIALAMSVSKLMKEMRGALFTKAKEPTISFTNGEFVTYCSLRPGSCAFLIHAPGLRKFTEEAKQSLSELAWLSANHAVEEAGLAGENLQLAVGFKGVLLYEAIMVGKLDGKAEPLSGIESRGKEKGPLYQFFKPIPQPPPAGSPSKH